MVDRGGDLSRRLQAGDHLRFMEAHSGLSALIANRARDPQTGKQFDGIWLSSLTATASAGLPDLEMPIVDRRLDLIERVALTSDKPVIVDADTGGDVSAFRFFCRALARVGVAAVIVEEKALPKRNSLDEADQPLMDPEAVAEKLRAGQAAISGSGMMVVARIESLVVGRGVDDALARAAVYAEAGLDGVLIHSRDRAPDQVVEFARRFRRSRAGTPVFCVPTTYSQTPAEELFEAGVQGVIYANHQLRAAHHAMSRACASILKDDCSKNIESGITSAKHIFDEVGYTDELAALRSLPGWSSTEAVGKVGRA